LSMITSLKGDGSDTIVSPGIMFSNTVLEAKCRINRLHNKPGNHVLNCFRTGPEATDIRLPADNLDLSKIYAYGTRSEKQIRYACYRLLGFVNLYDEIRTNRLHLGIGGALLGKRVKLFPNNYWKCEAIFNHSIKGRFNNVEWCGDPRG